MRQIGNYVRKYGAPRRILSDNSPQFRSSKWKKNLFELGIDEVHTAVRNLRGNPCERYIKVVGECLRISSIHQHSSWAKYLEQVENFINYNYKETTEVLPVQLQLKRNCTLGIERYIKYPPGREEADWETMRMKVRERLIRKAKKRNKYHKVRMIVFRTGQKVLLRRDWTSNRIKKTIGETESFVYGTGRNTKKIGIKYIFNKYEKSIQ